MIYTDDEGRFSIPGLQPGPHLLTINPASVTVDLGIQEVLIPRKVFYIDPGGLAEVNLSVSGK